MSHSPLHQPKAAVFVFCVVPGLLQGLSQIHQTSSLFPCHFCIQLPSLSPSFSFFFFNDVFADKTASVCKQLQNEIGIFNLLMGFSHVSKKAELSVALELLVSFFSPAFLLLPLKHRLNGILDAQLSVILWITLWLWLAWHFWFLNL